MLASGRGSNFIALAEAVARTELAHCQLIGVFSDQPAAAVLGHATERGIPVWAARASDYADRDAFDAALFAAVAAVQPDLIVCAGYMRIIGATALAPWTGRMINIHPSLLPNYPGLHTHRRVLAAGEPEHGASVHYVTAELDGGPVIAQVRLPVRSDDDEHSLAQRLLPLEHRLLVACVAECCQQRIEWRGGQVYWNRQPLERPLQLDVAARRLQVTG